MYISTTPLSHLTELIVQTVNVEISLNVKKFGSNIFALEF